MFACSAFRSVPSTAPSDASMGPSVSVLPPALRRGKLMSAVLPIPAVVDVLPMSRTAANLTRQRTANLSPMLVERSFASTRNLREPRL